jgi:hypothetical protein
LACLASHSYSAMYYIRIPTDWQSMQDALLYLVHLL